MRLQIALRSLSLIAAILGGGLARAEALPVVVAVDAALPAHERARAVTAIATLVRARSPDDALGVIVFADMVTRVVSLAPLDAAQLDAIDAALGTPDAAARSNLAVAVERGLDELRATGPGHLVLFAHARVGNTGDAADDARYRDWFREVLLPDAAEHGIALTLVAPDAEAAVAETLTDAHPANAVLPTGGDTGLGRLLLQRTSERADGRGPLPPVADTNLSAMEPDAGAMSLPSGEPTSSVDAGSEGTPAPGSDPGSDPAAIPGTGTVTGTGATQTTGSRFRLSPLALAALAVALAATLLAGFAFIRRRTPTPRRADDPSEGGVSSAYLPLHATRPSRPARIDADAAPQATPSAPRSGPDDPTRDRWHDATTAKGPAPAEAATAKRDRLAGGTGEDTTVRRAGTAADETTRRVVDEAEVETARRPLSPGAAPAAIDSEARPRPDPDAPTAPGGGRRSVGVPEGDARANDGKDDLELLAELTARRREQDRLD